MIRQLSCVPLHWPSMSRCSPPYTESGNQLGLGLMPWRIAITKATP
jgi:hypothetical protein